MPKLNYFNNTGGLNKFSSMTSLNDSEKNTDWFDAQNIESHKSGGFVKMKGCINILSSALPAGTKVLGIFDYIRQGNSYPVIVTSEGKLYRINVDTGVLTEKYSGLSSTAKCNFVNFNNGVIISNGVDVPVFYEEGFEAVALEGDVPIGVAIEAYKARIFIASGSGLYYCALGNPNDWTSEEDAGSIINFHNDSSPIITLKNYGEYLAIYKKNEIYILSGSAPADFIIKPVADKGCVSTWGIGTINNNQYYFAGDSVSVLNFNSLGQITAADDASIKIKSVFSELNFLRFGDAVCIPYPAKNQLWFYFSSESSESLNTCYIYDYFYKSWYKRVGLPITCGACINEKIYTCSEDGRILLEDAGDSFDGEPIKAWWFSPWFTFGAPDSLKQITALNIWVYQDLKHAFDVVTATDYSQGNKNFTSVTVVGEEDLLWDEGLWDVEKWSDNKAVRKKIPVLGSFEALQLGFQNLETGQPFSVLGYGFEYDIAG